MGSRVRLRRILSLPLLGIGLYLALWGGVFAICLAFFVIDELKHGGWDAARHTMPDLLICLAAAGAGCATAWLAVRLSKAEPSPRRQDER